MVDQVNFSFRLKRARENIGLTLFQAAQFSNLKPADLGRWEKANLANFSIQYLENGEANPQAEDFMPSYSTVHSLAVLYCVDLEWLVSGMHPVGSDLEG